MQLLGGRGPGWSRNSPSVGCHNLDENPGRRRSTASPRVPGRPEEPACWLLLQPASLRNPHRNHPGRGACGIGPRIRGCCRLISSKSYLERLGSHPRALCLPEFPKPSWPGRCEAPQGKDQRGICPLLCHRKTPGAAPTQCLSRKPPSPGALREGPGLRMQTTRLPGGGSETQLKSITAGERRAPSSEKEISGNPAPHPCRNPRLGMHSQPLAKERHSRVED